MSDPYLAFILGVGVLGALATAFGLFVMPQIEKRERRQQAVRHLPAE